MVQQIETPVCVLEVLFPEGVSASRAMEMINKLGLYRAPLLECPTFSHCTRISVQVLESEAEYWKKRIKGMSSVLTVVQKAS